MSNPDFTDPLNLSPAASNDSLSQSIDDEPQSARAIGANDAHQFDFFKWAWPRSLFVSRNEISNSSPGPITPAACVSPPSGLMAWYGAENNANDLEGKSNAMMLGGATFTAGKVGQAFNFDGVSGSVSTPGINLGNQYSVEFWMRSCTLAFGDPVDLQR